MPSRIVDRITPKAAPGTRRLTAALVWTSVGLFLAVKGIWISRETAPVDIYSVVLVGTGLGLIKGKLILDRVANRIIHHIGSKPHRACLGGLFSLRNWMLILLMVLLGRIVGTLAFSDTVKACIYVMIGSGLGYSSRLLWAAWRRSPSADT